MNTDLQKKRNERLNDEIIQNHYLPLRISYKKEIHLNRNSRKY